MLPADTIVANRLMLFTSEGESGERSYGFSRCRPNPIPRHPGPLAAVGIGPLQSPYCHSIADRPTTYLTHRRGRGSDAGLWPAFSREIRPRLATNSRRGTSAPNRASLGKPLSLARSPHTAEGLMIHQLPHTPEGDRGLKQPASGAVTPVLLLPDSLY